MEKNTILVFVYGTLKTGFHNNELLREGKADFVCDAFTKEGQFLLYASGIPFMVKTEKVKAFRGTRGIPPMKIKGEVWKVSEETLVHLDHLEGHPHFYCREIIPLMRDNGEEMEASCYLYPEPKGRLVESGEF